MRDQQLPALLQAVTLRLDRTTGESSIVPTKILDVEEDGDATSLIVTCPSGHDPREHHFDAWLTWTHPLGRISRPVTTHPAERSYGRVWQVVPTGAASRQQDRLYFRADMSVPVRVTWTPDDDPQGDEQVGLERREGVTVDVSEGGALALLRGDPPDVGTAVDLALLLAGDALHNPATVVRHVELPGGTGVGVSFQRPPLHEVELRRAVVEAERRSLRAAR